MIPRLRRPRALARWRRFASYSTAAATDPGQQALDRVSSLIISDVEKVIDHALIMKAGKIVADASFDELREKYSRVRLTSLAGPLPEPLDFANILECRRNQSEATLIVRDLPPDLIEAAAARIHCQADIQPLPLEDIYRLVVA
jgi:ABC-type multidrug transport system ATPase subunit